MPKPDEPHFREPYELLRSNYLAFSEEGLRKLLPQNPTHMELYAHDFGFTSGLIHALKYARPLPRVSVN